MKEICLRFSKVAIIILFLFLLCMRQDTLADSYSGGTQKVDYTFNDEFKFTRKFEESECIRIKLKVKKTGVYNINLPNDFYFDFYNDSEYSYSAQVQEEHRFFMFENKEYYISIGNYRSGISKTVELKMEYLGDNYGRPKYSCSVYEYSKSRYGGYYGTGVSERTYNKLGIFWKEDTLELNNVSIKDMGIDIGVSWNVTYYMPSEVLPNNANVKVKVIGENNFSGEAYGSCIRASVGTSDNIDFTYVGDGTINFDFISDDSKCDATEARNLTIDGPRMNFEKNICISAKKFILKNGEINYNFDNMHCPFIKSNQIQFIGGKVNIDGKYKSENKFSNDDIFYSDDCIIDGTNFDIKYVVLDDVTKKSYVLKIFSCENNFEMKSGSFNVTDSVYRYSVSDKLKYGLILVDAANAYIIGGDLYYEYAKVSQATRNESYAAYPIVKISDEIVARNASICIIGSSEIIDAYAKIDGNYSDDSEFYYYYNRYLKRGKIYVDLLNLNGGRKIDINKLGITLLEDKLTYDGTEKKPKLDLKALRIGKDVDVVYSNNINVGTGTVTVTGKGKIIGELVFTFEIVDSMPNEDVKKDSETKTDTEVNNLQIKKGNYIYKIITQGVAGKKKGTVEVIGLNKKNVKKIKIAKQIKYDGITYKVVSIGKKAFKGNKKVKSVIIGAYVKKIKSKAFANCKKLKKVIIKSKKITKIGKKAFRRKAGKKITFTVPKKVKKKYKKLIKNAKTNKYVIK